MLLLGCGCWGVSCFADNGSTPEHSVSREGVDFYPTCFYGAGRSVGNFQSGSYKVTDDTYGYVRTFSYNTFVPNVNLVDSGTYHAGVAGSAVYVGDTNPSLPGVVYTGSHGKGTYLNLQTAGSNNLYVYDSSFVLAIYNSKDEDVFIDRLFFTFTPSSTFAGFGAFSVDEGYSVNGFSNELFILTTPVRGFSVPAKSWLNVCVNVPVFSSSSAFPLTYASLNLPLSQFTFGNFPSQLPATDGAIRDQTEQQKEQYDEFTSGGDSSIVDGASGDIQEKVGIFTAVDTVLSGVWDIFSSPPGDATLIFPTFSLTVEGQSYKLWDNYVFDFNVLSEAWGFAALKTAINFITVFIVYGALLHYLQVLFHRVFGGGDG